MATEETLTGLPTYVGDRTHYLAQLKTLDLSVILANAQRLVTNTFVFDRPWEMEPCTTPVRFEDTIDWQHIQAGDPEWMFMLNRHGFFPDLAIAYLATGQEKYLISLKAMWRSWLATQGDGERNRATTWRPLDVGLRLKNWVKTLDILRCAPEAALEPELTAAITQSLRRQCEFLLNHHAANELLSNWLILTFHGVYITSLYLNEVPHAQRWHDEALALLHECITLQLQPDGLHWEQAFMYHHEVLITLAEAILVGQRNGDEAGVALLRPALVKMFAASLAMTPPDAQQLAAGDSDVERLTGVQNFARLVLTKPLKTLGNAEDQRVLFELYGAFPPTVVQQPHQQPEDAVLATSGHTFVRSSQKADATFLHFKNGFVGSGHGHADLLHVDLMVHGRPLLVDSGRYTYRVDDPKRQAYKAATAHNTLIVDGTEFTQQKRAWGTFTVADQVQLPQRVNQPIDLIQGMHLGYFPKAVVGRQIIYLKPDLFVFFDWAKPSAPLTMTRQFHFAPGVSATVDGQAVTTRDATGVLAEWTFLTDETLRLAPTTCSPRYNQEVATTELIATGSFSDQGSLPLVIDCQARSLTLTSPTVFDMDGRPVSPQFVRAVKIQVNAAEDWLIIANLFEQANSRKLLVVEGTPVFGKTVVCHRVAGHVTTTVLQ
ncbi:alginate lyase family protein [Lacticaseibacillus daqingensis]|uniref:alginate lyase family protein n=1 Tax=Lacticaseibacillus daqingensis TaxID=2486014 RepID=UPI000F7A56C9|nr:alginate lyase family protein [Lacticaseibacillus daqingensis]